MNQVCLPYKTEVLVHAQCQKWRLPGPRAYSRALDARKAIRIGTLQSTTRLAGCWVQQRQQSIHFIPRMRSLIKCKHTTREFVSLSILLIFGKDLFMGQLGIDTPPPPPPPPPSASRDKRAQGRRGSCLVESPSTGRR